MSAAVIVYPGSNCDRDCKVAVERSTGEQVSMVWHAETELPKDLDLIVIPGGFSYGDYLRCGAMAAQSAIMPAIKKAAEDGVTVVGICNGFQILCEAGLLPGALLRNKGLKYICKPISLQVANPNTRFTKLYGDQSEVIMTQGNGDGNYFADAETLKRIEDNGQVVFRYVDNPNGSVNDIAGIMNEAGNVIGMMPHPDRAFEAELGSADGATLFQSIYASL
ncbi:phosphoribosylformylglycinamidine synthase subunit PurQ [uncultured Brevundimonas sp.]|uniref:phosphoribosylformylglycinamidine synthase subunit PurQ n=1 Tax=uncultured Brevundimonas sp. TaxID=213418 RepID=UPI00260EE4CC|nr:phosphoribosylformylglycinamidine synthase subunit PurQ [uncultured Brevundimonas sp.]